MKYITISILIVLLTNYSSNAQSIKILFDASKAEMAGNADWLIDADLNNLGVNANGKIQIGLGDESNPQGFPTPAQSGISSTTPETFWTGALSAWAVDCAKQNYQVQSLPFNDSITYGNVNHPNDLMHFTIFIVCEPNILFTMTEKNAIVQYVKDGGRLFIIADHDISDRNGDGFDSPTIWNNLFTTNTLQNDPFGLTFDLQNYSQTTTNIANLPNDSCLHGTFGNVTKMQISGGTTITLNTSNNTTVTGLIYKTGASTTGNTNVFFARANYGLGKVCAIGDSSPSDDGTGDINDGLYNGYTGDANGQHQWLLMNATTWLASNPIPLNTINYQNYKQDFLIYPNPASQNFMINLSQEIVEPYTITISNYLSQNIQTITTSQRSIPITINQNGVYFISLKSKNSINKQKIIVNN